MPVGVVGRPYVAERERPSGARERDWDSLPDGLGGQVCVRKIPPEGIVSAFAGVCSSPGFSGDGGVATSAQLNGPQDVAIGRDGSVYIADTLNERYSACPSDGMIGTVAGSGSTGSGAGALSEDGPNALQAKFNTPSGVDVGPDGVIYIADSGNGLVRGGRTSRRSAIAPCMVRRGSAVRARLPAVGCGVYLALRFARSTRCRGARADWLAVRAMQKPAGFWVGFSRHITF